MVTLLYSHVVDGRISADFRIAGFNPPKAGCCLNDILFLVQNALG
jgi:hypothetical protein